MLRLILPAHILSKMTLRESSLEMFEIISVDSMLYVLNLMLCHLQGIQNVFQCSMRGSDYDAPVPSRESCSGVDRAVT